jgi:hypothetical protein
MDDVDSLHVEIDSLQDPLVGFCFIRDIDMYGAYEQNPTNFCGLARDDQGFLYPCGASLY